MKKELPTTIAQDAVLSRLGLVNEVKGYESAKALLEELGLAAWTEGRGAKRQIVVKIVDRIGGAFNQYGEGETWELAVRKVDLTPISEWIINPEHPRAPKPEPEAPKAEPAEQTPEADSSASTWGGARPGAGRPEGTGKAAKKSPEYQTGYQAGYKAAIRPCIQRDWWHFIAFSESRIFDGKKLYRGVVRYDDTILWTDDHWYTSFEPALFRSDEYRDLLYRDLSVPEKEAALLDKELRRFRNREFEMTPAERQAIAQPVRIEKLPYGATEDAPGWE